MTRRSRGPSRVVTAAVALAGLLALAAALPATPIVAVVGDSYVSGEGLPDATGLCGRSSAAWGDAVAAALGADETRVAACSGATVEDLTAGGRLRDVAQLDAVAGDVPPDVLLLLIGGNDLGFTQLVADCLGFADLQVASSTDALSASSWTDLLESPADGGCTASAADLRARVQGLAAAGSFKLAAGATGGLAELYAEAAAGVAPGGQLLVVGYPQLFAPPASWPDRYGLRCHGLRARDADAVRGASLALDQLQAAELARARTLTGVAELDVTLTFVSVFDAFAGTGGQDHGLCSGSSPYLHGLTVVEGGLDVAALLSQLGGGGGIDLDALGGRPGGSFHPNAAGHAAYADAVLDTLATLGEA